MILRLCVPFYWTILFFWPVKRHSEQMTWLLMQDKWWRREDSSVFCGNYHFRMLTQRVTFEIWDPRDIWSEWWLEVTSLHDWPLGRPHYRPLDRTDDQLQRPNQWRSFIFSQIFPLSRGLVVSVLIFDILSSNYILHNFDICPSHQFLGSIHD